jgi:hypothetical protein
VGLSLGVGSEKNKTEWGVEESDEDNFGPKKVKIFGGRKELRNEKLNNLYFSP